MNSRHIFEVYQLEKSSAHWFDFDIASTTDLIRYCLNLQFANAVKLRKTSIGQGGNKEKSVFFNEGKSWWNLLWNIRS